MNREVMEILFKDLTSELEGLHEDGERGVQLYLYDDEIEWIIDRLAEALENGGD